MSLDLWIEVRVRLRRDPKLRRLCRALEIQRTHALGIVVDLWLYAAEQGSEDGDLTSTHRRDLAAELEWPEDKAEELWTALTEAGPTSAKHPEGEPGFVTPDGKIHRWERFRHFFALALLKKDKSLQQGKERVRKHREKQRLLTLESNGDSNADVTDSNAHTGQTGPDKPITTRESSESLSMTPIELVELWNSKTAKPIRRVMKLTKSRERTARLRLVENPDQNYWINVIGRIAKSTFCQGVNDRGWVANIDFLLRPDTGTKALEGQYDDKKGTNGNRKPVGGAAPQTKKYAGMDET